MSKALFTLLLLGITTIIWAQSTLNPKFEQTIEGLLSHSIPTISCERLQSKLNTPNLVLLDAREKEEFTTSHLKNAQWVGYNTFDKKYVEGVDKNAIVVVYCSVGYRSEKIAEQLKALGYTKVYNLYGGIFEWTNRSYPLLDAKEKPTKSVHAYNKDWGRWLDKGNKVY
ncbi:MAG: rhodanese-like domain-containing protein [Aureispira sp.]